MIARFRRRTFVREPDNLFLPSLVLKGMGNHTGRRAIAATVTAMTLFAPLAATQASATDDAARTPAPGQAQPATDTQPVTETQHIRKARRTSTVVPDRVAFRTRDLTVRQTLGFDSGQSPLQPAAGGQYCDTTDNGATGTEPTPIGGRQWYWYSANTGGVSTTHIVTSWVDGAGALLDLANDTGACRFGALGYQNFTVTQATDREFAATYSSAGIDTAVHSILVRNTLVSVTVDDWGQNLDEAAEAARLAELSAAKVARTRLP